MIESALQKLQIENLNEMQQAAIEAAKTGDVILISPTGSGKTLGFLLPVLTQLDEQLQTVQALILVPSRELALQIETVFRTIGGTFKVNCCYGGHAVKTELNNFSQPPAVLIGTPGRIAHHLRRHSFTTETIHTLVLDEFDKSLEYGFQEDMRFIISKLPALKKRILTSATHMADIPRFTGVSDPIELNFLDHAKAAPDLKQKVVIADTPDKLDALFALLCKIGDKPTLVFCNHREAVDRISDLLWNRGLPHDIFHGGMEQDDRERTLIKFRNGTHRLLVTTDLAARGLDIPEIEHVVHYQLPHSEQAFLHRNGRTARMHAKGTSYLMLSPDEKPPYLTDLSAVEDLPTSPALPAPSPWATLYIGAGKKDKVNKVDIVGMLLKKGELAKDEVGLIEVLDTSSYVAIKRDRMEQVLQNIRSERIKNKRVKIELSK